MEATIKEGILGSMSKEEFAATFDTSNETCEALGFAAGKKVKTTLGESKVIGAAKGTSPRTGDGANELWFDVEGHGATYWPGYRKEDFEKKGFKEIQ